jgi:hypothetical protein
MGKIDRGTSYVSNHILSDIRQADRQAKANGKLDFVGVGCSAGR